MKTIIRLFLILGITFSSLILAQESNNPSKTDEKKAGRRAWLVATSLPKDIQSPVTVLAGGKISTVTLSKRAVGISISVPKDGLVQVVKPIILEDGKTTYEVQASALVPEEVKESLIILVPDPKMNPPILFRSSVVDLDKFRGGNALFVNITKLEIGISLGSKNVTLKSGQIEIIDTGKFDGAKNVTVSYHYRSPNEKKWNLISASTVSLKSSLREILIFSYNPELKRADYHGITFYVEKPSNDNKQN
jgi:hypothetical protein